MCTASRVHRGTTFARLARSLTSCVPRTPSEILRRREVSRDCRSRRDGGRHEVSSAAAPLTSLEVAVARARAALAGLELVWVHAEAHRATSVTPFESSVLEYDVESLVLGLLLHQ